MQVQYCAPVVDKMKIEPANFILREYHIIQDGGPLSDDFITKENFRSLSVFKSFKWMTSGYNPFLVESNLTRTADKFSYC